MMSSILKVLALGLLVSACQTSNGKEAEQVSEEREANTSTVVDDKTENEANSSSETSAQASANNPHLAGAMTCSGTNRIERHGYGMGGNSEDKATIIYRVRPSTNIPVTFLNTVTNTFDPVCRYDCQFMGNATDFSVRHGFSQARHATTAMGSKIETMTMNYRNGKLRTEIETQEMTPNGPTMETYTLNAECKPGVPA